MERRNIDFEVPVTREEWRQIAEAAAFRPDYGVLRWRPEEFEVIHVAIRGDDAPAGWSSEVPRVNDRAPEEREVACFIFNDGRPFAQLDPPDAPEMPAISPQRNAQMEAELEQWVRDKWQYLLESSGWRADRGGPAPR